MNATRGTLVLVGLTPNGFGLGLNPGYGAKYGECAIEDAQTTFYFSGEIDVARRIDNIDTLLDALPGTTGGVPRAGTASCGDSTAAFALLLHPVGDGGAFAALRPFGGRRPNKKRMRSALPWPCPRQCAQQCRYFASTRETGVPSRWPAEILALSVTTVILGASTFGGHGRRTLKLPAEVSEGAISLRHLVRVFFLLHHAAGVIVGIDDLRREGVLHRNAFARVAAAARQSSARPRLSWRS